MRARPLTAAAAALLTAATAHGQAKPPALAYAFTAVGDDPIVYRLSEVVDDPGRPVSTIAYVACRGKPIAWSGGASNLAFAFHEQQMSIGGSGGLSDFTPHNALFAPLDRAKGLVMDRSGRLTPEKQAAADDWPLPGAIGVARDLIIPQLSPDGASTWRVTRPWVMYRASPNPFEKPLQATGTFTGDYTARSPSDDGNVVPVTFTTDISVDGGFKGHVSGEGSFEFDVHRGLVRTLTARLVAEGTGSTGVAYTSPVTVDVSVLSPDAVAKLRESARKMDAGTNAAGPAGAGAGRTDQPRFGHRPAVEAESRDPAWADDLELPSGTQRTAFVGHSTGGGPFVSVGDGQRMVVGFRLKLGHWEHAMIGHVEPLYDRPVDLHPKDETVMVAKAGYAVGGLWLNGPDQADALRVIYMRVTPSGGLDLKDAYVGPWFGQVTGPERVKAGGTGQPVVGVYGRQGINTDALGVILRTDGTAGATTGDPTDDPNYKGSDATPPKATVGK